VGSLACRRFASGTSVDASDSARIWSMSSRSTAACTAPSTVCAMGMTWSLPTPPPIALDASRSTPITTSTCALLMALLMLPMARMEARMVVPLLVTSTLSPGRDATDSAPKASATNTKAVTLSPVGSIACGDTQILASNRGDKPSTTVFTARPTLWPTWHVVRLLEPQTKAFACRAEGRAA
jgi:hypothetical protein